MDGGATGSTEIAEYTGVAALAIGTLAAVLGILARADLERVDALFPWVVSLGAVAFVVGVVAYVRGNRIPPLRWLGMVIGGAAIIIAAWGQRAEQAELDRLEREAERLERELDETCRENPSDFIC